MSIVFASAVIPALAAKDRVARRGLRRTIVGLLAFNVLYVVLVIWVYPKICW
jgi:hypothetical protein